MAGDRAVILSRAEAERLTRQVGLAIIAPMVAVALGVMALKVLPESAHHHVWLIGVWVVLALIVAFYLLLGRLAHGIGRSWVYWCGGTFILQKVILIFAWIIAWFRIRSAVAETTFVR